MITPEFAHFGIMGNLRNMYSIGCVVFAGMSGAGLLIRTRPGASQGIDSIAGLNNLPA